MTRITTPSRRDTIDRLLGMGVEFAYVTLHVGIGTFRPIRTDDIDDHIMHAERYLITPETVRQTAEAKGRIIAVGTTSVRALESAACGKRLLKAGEAESRLFIKPPYEFKIIDGLITNFHIPRSTLLVLVSALAGRENILRAYGEAVERRYRFFSFGDAMFIKPGDRVP
ncbi:MAG: S-adenosylmethionine:tRNA ribosyltransferase-isomerase [Abditibacteriota bacterium]|nr:S-adenosylmethionine:tRNA ribosyltransferase-isomerase [Abditibacteriota bacterium]